MERIRSWYTANFVKLNISKTRVIAFTRKTNGLYYAYKIFGSSITRTDTIKDTGAQLDSKIYFHTHVDYVFSQSVRMLGLIRTIAYSFSTLDSSFILYITLVRSKLECACTVWNSITSTDAKKLESIQRKFVAICQHRFFTHGHVTYEDFLKFIKLRSLHGRRLYQDALFFISVYSGLKCCPSLLDTTGIRVLARNFRNSCTCKNSPSARCVSAANRVCTDIDIFRKPIISLKQILR
jgi:hypothetical protein